MPNVGWGELLLILLVALIVFGPRRLPEMMKSLGSALRAFQDESSRAVEQLRTATEGTEPDHGVIDRPDGIPPRDASAPPAPNGSASDFNEDT